MNYTLKIERIRRETADTVTLCFKQPGLKKVKYLSGQYLTLIFRINNKRYIRPYSFSSCPEVDSYLEVTVKRMQNGIVSNHINDIVKEGDSVEVMSPMGDFIYHTNNYIGAIYLWGVGSGITPLFSIVKQILFSENEVKVYLFYGNTNHECTIFSEQIEVLQHEFSNRFFVKHFHTRPTISKNNLDIVEGRIDRNKILNILKTHTDLINSAHYICGPSGLKESIKSTLSLLNVKGANIFSEDFELVKDPKEFENIHTRNIKLKFNDEVHNLEVIKGKTILEAALEAGIELPYSCQTGNCSQCKGKCIDGESKMIGLTQFRTDLKSNETLLCCTHPVTDNVYIEI